MINNDVVIKIKNVESITDNYLWLFILSLKVTIKLSLTVCSKADLVLPKADSCIISLVAF